MSDEKDTDRLIDNGGALKGDELLQAMRLDMQQLVALVKGLDQKVDVLGRQVESLDQRVGALDHKVEALDQRVEALDQRVGALDQRVGALDHKVDALDAKVEARLRDTTPMWEAVVARLDAIVTEQESHGRRLDGIEVKLERLEAIETELRQLRRRIERMIGELSRDVLEVRAAQHDLEDRLEKLEKTPV